MKHCRFAILTLAVLLAFGAPIAPTPTTAAEVIVVPPGNRMEKQPKVYAGSRFLTAMRGSGTFEDKYRQVYKLLATDGALIAKIKEVSALYGVDPVHVIGAIVGEHTYNIDSFDTLQTYYVKALQYADAGSLSFENKGETAQELFARPEFARCQSMPTNYEVWDCRQTVWNRSFMGKMVKGKVYPRDRLHRVYFKPKFGGQTFGFGQLSPIAALMVTDRVSAESGLPQLSIDNPTLVYQHIMNPDTSLHYVAANIRVSIDLYRDIAGFDISQNPGLSATLYNLGDAATRARELRAANEERVQKGQPQHYPVENFYGWLVNDREAELRQLL